LARFASRDGVRIDSAEVDVRASFPIGEKYGIKDEVGSAMEGLTYRLELKSPSPRQQVARVAALAERFCHASQTLRVAVPVEPSVVLNGMALGVDTLTSG
jgi:hypothetical protein